MKSRFFAVRNRVPNHLGEHFFASDEGWKHFQRSTIFEFTRNDIVDVFRRGLHDNCELVEITFTPVPELN